MKEGNDRRDWKAILGWNLSQGLLPTAFRVLSVPWCVDQKLHHLKTKGWNWQQDANPGWPATWRQCFFLSLLQHLYLYFVVSLGSTYWFVIWVFMVFCLFVCLAFRARNPWQMRKQDKGLERECEGLDEQCNESVWGFVDNRAVLTSDREQAPGF